MATRCSQVKFSLKIRTFSNSLSCFQTKIDDLQKETPVIASKRAKILLKQIESDHNLFFEFVNTYETLESLPVGITEEDLEENVSKIHDLFRQTILNAEMFISDKEIVTDASLSASSHFFGANATLFELPRMELPTFDGKYTSYAHFRAEFISVVSDNENLNDTHKLKYLKNCLNKEALNLIRHLRNEEANYSLALSILDDRYQCVKTNIKYHCNELLNLPSVQGKNSESIRHFCDKYTSHFNTLKTVDPDDIFEHIYACYLMSKLDANLRLDVERKYSNKKEFLTTKDIVSVLSNIAKDLESANFTQKSLESTHKPQNKRTVLVSSIDSSNATCFLCQKEHIIYNCPTFLNKNPSDRFKIVKKHNRCTNCLRNHTLSKCESKFVCKTCKKKHHTLLHFGDTAYKCTTSNTASENTTAKSNNLQNASDDDTSSLCVQDTTSTILLATTLVRIQTSSTNYVVVRAVLDSASHVSFITENCAQRLGCSRQKAPISIAGVKDAPVKDEGFTSLSLTTLTGRSIAKNHPFVILNRITADLPRKAIAPHLKEKVKSFVLADPSFNMCSPIDCLIGADLYAVIVSGAPISLGKNLPVLINTQFGHVLLGKAPILQQADVMSTYFSTYFDEQFSSLNTTCDDNLPELLKKFWKIEEPPTIPNMSKEDVACENFYSFTTKRLPDGRYQVQLPFKEEAPPLGDSYEIAHRRFLSLEKRLNAQPELKRKYIAGMRDYLEQGHMQLLDPSAKPEYYIPHLGVFKSHGDTQKLRIVFDCSSKTSNGQSLNSILMTGPKLQTTIQDIIMLFRLYPFVFTCDIQQMFRQIQLHPEDQKYLCLLWREDSKQPLQTFQLTTVTFGVTCSPYLAIRTLHQLAKDDGLLYPLAAKTILQNSFVDDFCVGAHTLSDVEELQQQLINLCNRGGFRLSKWASNSPQLLHDIPVEQQELTNKIFTTADQPSVGVLGLRWNPQQDTLTYNLSSLVVSNKINTKRSVLSTIAKIYDICGYISPFVITLKAFIQQLWLLPLDWDDQLPKDYSLKWNELSASIAHLKDVSIPRCSTSSGSTIFQLHGFSDASLTGYSAAIYLKGEDDSKPFLIFSKTKVAPLKSTTIPRLELLGAHLLARTVAHCKQLLSTHIKISSTVLWTDSTIVLSWIRTPSHLLKTFVANRVSQIIDWSEPTEWRHVPTDSNPADIASRGENAISLPTLNMWWHGPSFLLSSSDDWPQDPKTLTNNFTLEHKTVTSTCLLIPDTPPDIFKYISNWSCLISVVAKILQNFSKRTFASQTDYSRQAVSSVCYYIQQQSFAKEIIAIKEDRPCPKPVQRLRPFLDSFGLIRVGGRLSQSNESYDLKHPILLPKDHRLVTLLIDHYHVVFAHTGISSLVNFLSNRFWILSVKQLVRTRIYRCIQCFRYQPRNNAPLMGDLPSARVTPSIPFTHTGMDFAGPFLLKTSSLRKAPLLKHYLCIFICFSTKAVHIELVSDLSSRAFIAALQRFISRRGYPSHLYSDCGTNFQGAAKIIARDFKNFLSEPRTLNEIRSFTIPKEIEFHTIPPGAPHQGGLWERAIQSAKRHLSKIVGNHNSTYEEFLTLCIRVEGILNSRPITPMSMDPNDLSALTPAHFLVGRPITEFPETNYTEVPINRLRQYQLIQLFVRQFWQRWQKEYLHSLQPRQKWDKDKPNLLANDLVIVEEPNVPPLTWPLARVLVTYPGKDGVVRSAKVKTSKGEYVRPTLKLYKLPIEA